MNSLHQLACTLLFLVTLASSAQAQPRIATNVPLTAEMATVISGGVFPVSIKMDVSNLFLTEPEIVYADDERVAIRVKFQAFDHRPEQGIALSETGLALVSGELGFDTAKRNVLLHNAKIDALEFNHRNTATKRFESEIRTLWSATMSSPMATPLPPHPYLNPFRDYIQDITYDGANINLKVAYQ